ncbi:MAG: ABC transporter ATP-binding protein [Chloroflexi bacterium]|nr:ABC transporter ATP-binding protein [Chloroflexota bacterium]
MTPIIEIKDLVKTYGKLTAVSGLSLQVQSGAIFGFVGPNGAGKTTTMRILTTLMAPTSGEAYVAGYSVIKNPRDVRRAIGYMPDFFGVYDDMTVWEYLDFFGACYEIPEARRPAINQDLLELVDLAHRRDDRVEALSRGMKQRLALARTLAHDPRVLILDEPASGLDPRARIEIRELLVELARMGKTIFFSTHILADVAEICTDVGIVEAGKLVAVGKLEDMQRRLMPHRRIHVTLLDKLAEARAALAAVEGVAEVEVVEQVEGAGRARLVVEYAGDDAAVSAILARLVAQGIPVVHFSEDVRDMEEVFMRATKGIVS